MPKPPHYSDPRIQDSKLFPPQCKSLPIILSVDDCTFSLWGFPNKDEYEKLSGSVIKHYSTSCSKLWVYLLSNYVRRRCKSFRQIFWHDCSLVQRNSGCTICGWVWTTDMRQKERVCSPIKTLMHHVLSCGYLMWLVSGVLHLGKSKEIPFIPDSVRWRQARRPGGQREAATQFHNTRQWL